MKFPPLANPPPIGQPIRFGQTPREREQRKTLAIALAMAAGGYLLLKYTAHW